LWRKIVGWSKAEIQPIYDELGVSFDVMHGESFYEDAMEPLLEKGKSEGIFVESQGALVCVSDNDDEPPAILRKSDGATLYLTRDLARIDYWEKTWHPEVMMVVVDAAQNFAQKQLYGVARKLQLTKAELVQVNFGRMRFADGSMSTRKGNILLLSDLIAEAKTRALELVQAKSHNLSEQDQHETASILAINSIKYNILSQNRMSDITFDWSTMLNFDGNSAPYLAYTLVRVRSLLAKADFSDLDVSLDPPYGWDEHIERGIVLQLADYDNVFLRTLGEYKLSHLATYAFSLAQNYNNLYNQLPILQAEEAERTARLQLSTAVEATLKHCFECLGLTAPKRM
jgi:arginyl-tRNA synthetase